MATTSVSNAAEAARSAQSTNNAKPEIAYAPFQWHRDELVDAQIPGRYLTNLAGAARDIASGVETIMGIIERDLIEKDCENKHFILRNSEGGNLMRLAIRSMSVLVEMSEESLDHAWEQCTPEGQADKAKRLRHVAKVPNVRRAA